jgi:hypothetical protein
MMRSELEKIGKPLLVLAVMKSLQTTAVSAEVFRNSVYTTGVPSSIIRLHQHRLCSGQARQDTTVVEEL